MTEPAASLIVKDLIFRYWRRDKPAIENVSFTLHPGQVMLIAGVSGCCKDHTHAMRQRSTDGRKSLGQFTNQVPASQLPEKGGVILNVGGKDVSDKVDSFGILTPEFL